MSCFFEMIFFMMRPLHEEFNDFLADIIGASINYVAILMGVIALPLLYSAYLVIHNSIRIVKTKETKPHLANIIIAPIVFGIISEKNKINRVRIAEITPK